MKAELLHSGFFNLEAGRPNFEELAYAANKCLEVESWNLANWDDLGEVNQLRILSERKHCKIYPTISYNLGPGEWSGYFLIYDLGGRMANFLTEMNYWLLKVCSLGLVQIKLAN